MESPTTEYEPRPKNDLGRFMLRSIGRVLPFVDPIQSRSKQSNFDQEIKAWYIEETIVRKSGRITEKRSYEKWVGKGYHLISSEWTPSDIVYRPFVDTPEKKAAFEATFEEAIPPPGAHPAEVTVESESE